MTYAATTTVAVDRSRAEIEQLARRHGCTQFMCGVDYEHGTARVQFKAKDRIIRFELTLPDRTKYRHEKAYEQASRSRWRALVLVLKGKLESVEAGIATFEEEFLPFVVMPNDRTVADILLPMIESSYASGQMPRQLIGAGGADK